MDMGWMVPVGVVASMTAGGAFTTWVRARHGYPLEDDKGNPIHRPGVLDADRKFELLSGENEMLKGRLGRLEERISVLERIATDGSVVLSHEIDALR